MSDDRSQAPDSRDSGSQDSGSRDSGSQDSGNQDPGSQNPGDQAFSLDKGGDSAKPDPTYGYGPPTYGDPTAPSSPSSSYGDPSAPPSGPPTYGEQTSRPTYGEQTSQPTYGEQSGPPAYGGYAAPPSYGDQSGAAPTYDPNASYDPSYAAAGAAVGAGAGGAYGAGGYGAPGSPGGYGPPPKKKSRTGLVIGLIAVGLVVVIGIVVGVVALASGGGDKPSATVQAYLQALSEGNAEKALEQGEKPPDTTFATSSALKSQQDTAKISAIEVNDGYSSGNRARVSATYKFGDKQADESFSLTKIGGDWKLDDTVYPIDLSSLGDVPGLTLLGIDTDGKDKAYVFPGPLAWGSSNEYLTVKESDADDFTLSPSDGTFSFSTLETGLSDAGETAVADAVTTYITNCAKSKDLEPENCSQAEYDYEAVDGSATWTPPEDLSSLEYRTSSPVTEVYVSGDLTWSVTYTTKDYTGKTASKTVDDVDGSLYGKVDLSKSPPVYSE